MANPLIFQNQSHADGGTSTNPFPTNPLTPQPGAPSPIAAAGGAPIAPQPGMTPAGQPAQPPATGDTGGGFFDFLGPNGGHGVLGLLSSMSGRSAETSFEAAYKAAVAGGSTPQQALVKIFNENPEYMHKLPQKYIEGLGAFVTSAQKPALQKETIGRTTSFYDNNGNLKNRDVVPPDTLFEEKDGQVIYSDPSKLDGQGNPVVHSTAIDPKSKTTTIDNGSSTSIVAVIGGKPTVLATYPKGTTPDNNANNANADEIKFLGALAAMQPGQAMPPGMAATAKKYGVTSPKQAQDILANIRPQNAGQGNILGSLLTATPGGAPAPAGGTGGRPAASPTPLAGTTPAPAPALPGAPAAGALPGALPAGAVQAAPPGTPDGKLGGGGKFVVRGGFFYPVGP